VSGQATGVWETLDRPVQVNALLPMRPRSTLALDADSFLSMAFVQPSSLTRQNGFHIVGDTLQTLDVPLAASAECESGGAGARASDVGLPASAKVHSRGQKPALATSWPRPGHNSATISSGESAPRAF
jgi:hypothetical protein